MFKSSNPLLSRMDNDVQMLEGAPMTVSGTITKTFILLLIAAVSAAAVVYEAFMGYADKVMMIMGIALFAGLDTGLVTEFAALSLIMETQFPGIAMQAVAATFFTFFIMLVLYRTGAIRATEKFRATIMSAMLTILVLYLINFVGGFFNFSIPFISGYSKMGIVFSVIVVLVAALSLILDFDFIEQGAQKMLPKDYEWYGSFGLLVTLVWLYVEILRLLSRLRKD